MQIVKSLRKRRCRQSQNRIENQVFEESGSVELQKGIRRLRSRNTRRRLLLESLEGRRLLAVAGQPFSPLNDVVFEGDSTRDTVQFSVVDGYLQHNQGSRPGFESDRDLDSVTPGEQALLMSEIGSLTYNDLGNNDPVTFVGGSEFQLDSAPLNVRAGSISVSAGTTISATDGVIDLLAAEDIRVDTGASISTVDGGILLAANPNGLTNGDRYSVHLHGGSLSTSGTGNIEITGTGGYSSGGFDAGVGLEAGASVASTSTLPTAGAIYIQGTGKTGAGSTHNTSNWGVHALDAGTSVTSAYGDILISGIGGYRTDTLTASSSWGLNLQGILVESTGTGPDAATITIDGRTPDLGFGNSRISGSGVRFSGSDVSIQSVDGDISIIGRGGDANELLGQHAVDLDDFGGIWSTGTGDHAANILIDGQLGNGVAESISYGVSLTGDDSVLSTVDGDITISGSAGAGTGDYRHGVSVSALVSSLGTGPQAGNITVTGTAGAEGHGAGTSIGGQWSTVDGDIQVSGTGYSDTVRNGQGLTVRGGIASTGVGIDAGKISLTGTGISSTTKGTTGIQFVSGNYAVTTVDGDIAIDGTGSPGGTGIVVESMDRIASTGTGEFAGQISISGSTSAGGRGGAGVSIQQLDTGISSVDGDITLFGASSDGTILSNRGLQLINFGVIESTGIGPAAAKITIEGVAGDGSSGADGISLSSNQPTAIRSVDGDIRITGTGGNRIDPDNRFSENRGVFINNVDIESTGTTTDAATIVINGSGGQSGRNGDGVYWSDGELNSVVGDVSVTGTATLGRGVYLNRTATESTVNADLSLSGSSVLLTGDVSTIDGNVSILGDTSASYNGNFQSTGLGTFQVEASGSSSQANVTGNIQSSFGDISVSGAHVSVGNIHSTGTGLDAAAINIGQAASHVVRVSDPVSTIDGPITIENKLDPNSTASGYTLVSSTITSTGIGPDVGSITVIGEGSLRQGGVRFWSAAGIESIDGDISISGTATEGGNGVELDTGFQFVRSTGTGANAGSISITGTGGNDSNFRSVGILIDGNDTGVISVADGDLELHGTGGDGSNSNKGIELRELTLESVGLSSSTGQITIIGNGGSGTSSSTAGILLEDVEINTIKNDVLIQGQGGNNNGSSNAGIRTVRTQINSTGSGANAASITLDGTGGGGYSPHGIWISTGTELVSGYGDIRLIGQGGTLSTSPPSRSESKGVYLSGNSRIESNGFGDSAANIVIEGIGGAGRSLNNGVDFAAAGGQITTYDGDVTVTGTGGTLNSRGIEFEDWEILSQGFDENAGKITFIGVGAGNQPGILLDAYNGNYDYALRSYAGDIALTGTGSPTSIQTRASNNPGSGVIESLGSGQDAANLLIDGNGGYVTLARDLSITTRDGAIDVTGSRLSIAASIESTGTSSIDTGNISLSSTVSGITVQDITTHAADLSIVPVGAVSVGGRIESTLSTTNAGTITIEGASSGNNGDGIAFGTDGEIVSTVGDILLTGTSGPNFGYGIDAPRITSLGTDKSTAATITLIGDGNADGGSGIRITAGNETSPNISTIAGNVLIQGTAGDGSGHSYQGVSLYNAFIESLGETKADAGTITIVGTGGDGTSHLTGVDIRNSQSDIVSAAGDISITGIAGSGTSSQNYGVLIQDASLIRSTGTGSEAANISISGTSDSTWGVYLQSGRIEADGSGQIDLTAVGPGNGINDDLFVSGSSVIGGTAASGAVNVFADSIGMQAPSKIQTAGAFTLQPRTPGTTVGLGSGVGDLVLDNSELALLGPDLGDFVIGSESAPVSSVDLVEVVLGTPLTVFADVVAGQDITSSHTVSFGTTVSPGSPLGTLLINGDLELQSGNTLQIDIDGAFPSDGTSGYDQIQVQGQVSLDPGTKLVTGTNSGFPSAEDQQYVIIDNDGSDPIVGIFDGLPEGTIVEGFLGTALNVRISYLGTDGETGNDVVLTTTDVRNPIYDFSSAGYQVEEGDIQAVTDIVTIHRSVETSIPTSVDLIVSSGTATAGIDFRPEPITIQFAAGEVTKTVPVTILGERLVEENETIELSLGNFSDYGFSGTTNPTSTLTLINDEFAPIANAGGDYTLGEGSTITLDASASSDFEDANNTLLFEWDLDFADGVFNVDATGEQLPYTRPDGPDSKIVGLRVTDTEGNASLTTTTVTTTNVAPLVSPQPPQTIKAYNYAHLNLPVPFSDPGLSDTHIVEIDYGDGTPVELFQLLEGERGVLLDHRYQISPGSTLHYIASVTVTDSDGATMTQDINVAVEDLALTVPDNRPTVSFQTLDFNVFENQSYRVFPIIARLDRPFTQRTSIPLDLSSSTATLDQDFILSSTVLEFLPNQTTVGLDFRTINDTAYEPNAETLVLDFLDTIEAARFTGDSNSRQLVAQIFDDNDARPTLSFSTTRLNVNEGDVFQLDVQLSDIAQEDVVVPIVFDDSDSNFTIEDSTVLIPAGTLSASTTVTVTDDELSEPESTFFVYLGSNAQGFAPDPRQSLFIATVPANDAILLDFDRRSVVATEGGQNVEIKVVASEAPLTDLVLPLTYESSSAESGTDFEGPETVTLEEGQTEATFTITISNDDVGELDESVLIRFAEDLDEAVQLASPSVKSNLLIRDDDVAKLTFSTKLSTIWEDHGELELTIETGGITFAEEIEIPISFSAATSGATYNRFKSDLTGPSGSVTLPADQDSVTVSILAADDSFHEITERGYLVLGTRNIPGAQLGETPAHEIRIKDNDPLVSISTDDSVVTEDSGTILFKVTLAATSNLAARIPFSTYGSASSGSDFSIVQETRGSYKTRSNYIEIEPGHRVGYIKAKLKDDAIIEARETLGVWLKPKVDSAYLTNATIEGSQYSRVTIDVDESPRPGITQVRGKQPGSSSYTSTSTWIREGGSLRIRVSLPNAADRSVWVPVSFPYSSGRAKSSGIFKDFTTGGLSNGWLEIPAFKKSAYFYIHTVDDLRKENNEKIRATLGQPVVWDRVREKYVNFGGVGYKPYQFVGIRSSDQDTVYCPNGVKYNALAIDTGCVVDAGTTSSGPTPENDWTAGSPGSLQIANGYLGSSEVFLDGNFNGVRDFIDLNNDGIQNLDEPEEPLVATFDDGSFLIDFPVAMDRDSSGQLDANEAQLVAFGGTDRATGITDESRLTAPAGSFVVTPLTTLASKLVNHHSYSVTDAHERVLAGLQLATFEYWRASAISATVAGDIAAANTYPATNVVNSTAIIAGRYLGELSGATVESTSDAMYEQMAEQISTSGSRLRLSDPIIVADLINTVALGLGVDTDAQQIDSLAGVIATNNAALYNLPVSADLAFLESVTKLKIVARGSIANDAVRLARGEISASELTEAYSPENQDVLAGATTAGVIEPVRMAISDVSVVEGDDGSRFADFSVEISAHFNQNVSVDYATEDATATEQDGDYIATSGMLTWAPGDPVTQTIRVPITGDELTELDEDFHIVLTDASGAILQKSIGVGTILADDDWLIDLGGSEATSEVLVTIEGNQLLIRQDSEVLLDGRLNKTANITLVTDADTATNVFVDAERLDEVNRGLTIESQSDRDSLHLNNQLIENVTHIILGAQDGIFEAEEQQLLYRGFSQVSNDRAPRIELTTDVVLGETFSAEASVPTQLPISDSTFLWTLSKGSQTVTTSNLATFSYNPEDPGLYRLEYAIQLSDESIVSAVLDLNIVPLNEAPTANAGESYTMDEGASVLLDGSASTDPDLPEDVLVYHWDLDGDGLYGETGMEAGRGDEVGISPVFQGADLNGPAQVSIGLRVTDSYGASSESSAVVNVINTAPELTFDTSDVSLDEGESASKLISASDVPGDSVTVSASFGDIAESETGDWIWTYEGNDDQPTTEVTITATDSDQLSSTVTFNVTVTNQNPTANDDVISFGEDDASEIIDVLGNDSDPAGPRDPLQISSIDASGLTGIATLTDGVISYDPAGSFESLSLGQSTTETFTYTIDDGDGGTDMGTVVITINGVNDAPVVSLSGSIGEQVDGQSQRIDWDVSDIDGDLATVALSVTQDGQLIESLSGPVEATGGLNFDAFGTGEFFIELTATDSAGATDSSSRTVTVTDDDVDSPAILIAGSSGTQLESDTNQYSWTIDDASGLSAFTVTVTRDSGEGPVAIYTSSDIADADGSFNFDAFGVGIYEILIVATDGDDDWAGDGASGNAGRTSVVGELFVSTSTRAKLETDDGQWVTLHRADVSSTHDGDILFDHSQLSHPWFSWWTPNLDAFHMLADGSMILSTDGRGQIGEQDFRNGGIVQFFGDEWLARNPSDPGQLHQTARMIASEQQLFGHRSWFTGIDAISIAPDGNLVISLDHNRSLSDGQSYHRGDLIKIYLGTDGDLRSSELYFSHQILDATGHRWFGRFFGQGVNVDGAHVLEDGRILISVSSTATVGDDGPQFKDGDVFVYDPTTELAESLFDEDNFRRNEEVDAVFLGLGNGELTLLDE